MTTAQDRRAIKKALREVPVSEGQWAMAWILYNSEAGLDATLQFIYGLEPRGLLLHQQAPHWQQLSLPDETH
jgi:hypothetical protein